MFSYIGKCSRWIEYNQGDLLRIIELKWEYDWNQRKRNGKSMDQLKLLTKFARS